MSCGKCQADLNRCTCEDLEQRLDSVKNFVYKKCMRCRKHYARCRCALPIWGQGGGAVERNYFPVMLTPRERKDFPDCPQFVAWEFVLPHNEQACLNHKQTLQRLAERGGLAPSELVAVLEDRKWKDMTMRDAVDALKTKQLVSLFKGPETDAC